MPCLNTGWHSEVLGVRASSYEFGKDTIQPVTEGARHGRSFDLQFSKTFRWPRLCESVQSIQYRVDSVDSIMWTQNTFISRKEDAMLSLPSKVPVEKLAMMGEENCWTKQTSSVEFLLHCLLTYSIIFSSTVLADKIVAGARVWKHSEWKLETDKIPCPK